MTLSRRQRNAATLAAPGGAWNERPARRERSPRIAFGAQQSYNQRRKQAIEEGEWVRRRTR